MRIFLLFPFLLTAICLTSHAEYRVFTLKISKKNPDSSQPAAERTIQSTLDPIQYREYYPVHHDETVQYTDTWMCKGRTDNQLDFCPNPKAQIPETPVSNSSTP